MKEKKTHKEENEKTVQMSSDLEPGMKEKSCDQKTQRSPLLKCIHNGFKSN